MEIKKKRINVKFPTMEGKELKKKSDKKSRLTTIL